ncbi:RNA-binding protein 28 [Arctopsyche grandis]|uniref:RNA-binding protein 28 n=1 Tax=Arctopsyche grandis TaxID=121162 RepID=UPI00406D8C77
MAKNKQQFKNKGKPLKGKKPFKGKGKKNLKPLFDTNARLVVRNLSFKTTEAVLKQHFEAYGKIAEITLPKRPNGDLVGCGFIQYENLEEAKQGLESRNGQPFLGRSLQIDWALPKEAFVAKRNEDIKSDITTTEAKTEAEPTNDAVDDDMTQKNSEKQNIRKQKREFKGKKDDPVAEETVKKSKVLRKARLIVRNISFKATEETLKKHFEPFGEISEVTLLKKPNGYLVGCGFVQFKTVHMATKAILETNAKPYLGRAIHVDWAIAKNKYMSHITEKEDELKYLQNDVKSEPEESEDEKENIVLDNSDMNIKEESDGEHSDDEVDDEADSEDAQSDGDSEDAQSGADSDDDMEIKEEPQTESNLKVSANDAEDGRTIFLKNVSFSVTNEDLEEFAKQFGEINYALVCVDKLTEHSKGSAFVRFKSKEDADIFLSAAPERLLLHDQTVQPLPAMYRDRATKDSNKSKQPKDARHLYLIKEGLILANSKAAQGVSTSDMAKRLALEQSKSQMLRNLNRFISVYRLNIHNIPPHFTDVDLRRVCIEMTNVKPYCLKECRIMKHIKGPLDADGKHMSKGYGFVMFTKHEDALTCLRRLNNNPSVFDPNNRPIVSFSIEDKAVINARKKRLEKSKIKNPLHRLYRPENNEKFEKAPEAFNNKGNNKYNKNKFANGSIDRKEYSSNKIMKPKNKPKGNYKPQNQNDFKNAEHEEGFVGETAKPGKLSKMRNRYKLKMQANMHKENVKQEKRLKKITNQKKMVGAKEKIKQPKQKQNTSEKKKKRVMSENRSDKNFSDLVNKYKSKLVAGSSAQKVKSKWYEQ